MKRLVFLEESVRPLFHAVLVASIYLLFVGHNQPGGGFVGGLVAGSAISLRYLTGGIGEVRRISRFRPWNILGAGLTLSAATAFAPVLLGRPVLTSLSHALDLPVFGEFKVSTTLAFDSGVYVLVIGMVFMVFEAFGDDAETGRDWAELEDGTTALDPPVAPPLAVRRAPAAGEGEQ